MYIKNKIYSTLDSGKCYREKIRQKEGRFTRKVTSEQGPKGAEESVQAAL